MVIHFEEFLSRGKNIFESSTNTSVIEPIKHAIKDKKSISYEASLKHKDGKTIWAYTTWTPVFDTKGEIDKLIAIDSDISKQKEAELEITIQKEELSDKNKQLNTINEELQISYNKLNDIIKILNEQKKEIENSHKKTRYSITYAKNIQKAIFPSHQYINQLFAENFILFKPRDIVSGDFYYFKQIGNYIYVAVADCTGHGVPGALMSMLGIALLNEIIADNEIFSSGLILNELRKLLKISLHQDNLSTVQHDGLDISFCIINTQTKEMCYSGAHQPLIIYRDNLSNNNKKLQILPADKQPVGVYLLEKPFTEHKFQLKINDILYLFTDGYASQFGGENTETLKISRLKKIISDVSNEPLENQKQFLTNFILNWKQNNQQTDDILLIGLKI